MRIVIEDYPYPEARLREVMPARMMDLPDKKGEVRPPYVGYCYNPRINDCVFFLPKVVLTQSGSAAGDDDDSTGSRIFGRYHPVDLLNFDSAQLGDADRRFLRQFAVWIYRAINVFYRNNDTSIVGRETYVSADASHRKKAGGLVDSILSLIQFARDNRDFIMFEIRNIHRGYNRVNWRKTVSHQQPARQGKAPVYINPVNKKKQIDLDEELLMIFHSILGYVRRQYGFTVEIACNYETIKRAEFNHYLNGYGTRRLRQIKYKYFSDKALKLWSLCYGFFDCTERLGSSADAEDYLVAKDFDKVFEAIVDTILGEELPSGFKSQKDGKIVDHIYPYESLINPRANVYHIADSKYYKIGAQITGEAEYKQFTYAKNVIQRTFDILFGSGNDESKRRRGYLPYRDPLTEGYNITPNFFISAKIGNDGSDERYSYTEDHLLPHDTDAEGNPVMRHRSVQFENRLFDRDTLILSHYDINFLYLIALYGKGNHFEQEEFRRHARRTFRSNFIRLLRRYYRFYKVNLSGEALKTFVDSNYRDLQGKLYHFDGILVMALEKSHPDSSILTERYNGLLSEFIIE